MQTSKIEKKRIIQFEYDKTRVNDLIMKIYIFVYMFSYLFSSVYKIFNKISIIIDILLISILMYNNKDKLKEDKYKYIIVYTLQVIFLLTTLVFKGTGIGSILHMLVITSILMIAPKIEITSQINSIIRKYLPIYYLLFLCTSKEHLNTNYVGYIFLCLFILSVIAYKLYNRGNFSKLAIMLIITLLFTYCFRCRTAMLASIIYFLLILLIKNVYQKKVFKASISTFIVFGSLLFSICYVALWKSGFYINLTFFVGKSLYSGRNSLWAEALDLIVKNPIIGVGSKYILNSFPTYAFHNTVFMICVTFGIPSLLLYYYNLTNFIKEVYSKLTNIAFDKVVIASIIILFFVDFFESYTYWSNYNGVLLFIIVYLLNKDNKFNSKQNGSSKVYIFEEGVDRMGGVERVVSTLANELSSSNNIEVVSFYKTREEEFFEYKDLVKLNYLTVQKHRKSEKVTFKSSLYYFFRIIEKITDYIILNMKLTEKCEEITSNDIVICGRIDVAIKIIPFIEESKKIIVRDAIHFNYYNELTKRKIIKILPKVTVLIVSSDESKKIYEKLFVNSNLKIEKIYNPLGIEPKIGYSFKNRTIIAIGRMSSQKGYNNLLKAFKIVNEKYSDWKLKILGSTDKELQNYINELDIKNNVILENGKSDVVPELNASSIYVMTSRYEGYANALVEAMACGVPSITYNWLCGSEEIITNKKDGIIVKLQDREKYASGLDYDKDVKNLANSIIYLIEHEHVCKDYSTIAAEKINQTRNKNVIINKWREIINE